MAQKPDCLPNNLSVWNGFKPFPRLFKKNKSFQSFCGVSFMRCEQQDARVVILQSKCN